MTKDTLITSVSVNTGISKAEVRSVIEETIGFVMESIASGETIYIRGFGTLGTKYRKKKIARNISAGTKIEIPAHREPHFKPSSKFKNKVSCFTENKQ